MRILVVEDDHDLLTVTAERLADSGFDVLCASTGREALTLLKQHEVDIVFADVLLPGMSGLELAHQVHRRHRRIRVILTSGVVPLNPELPGGMLFVSKPYQFADLVSTIRKAS